jgi:hypothetical protein
MPPRPGSPYLHGKPALAQRNASSGAPSHGPGLSDSDSDDSDAGKRAVWTKLFPVVHAGRIAHLSLGVLAVLGCTSVAVVALAGMAEDTGSGAVQLVRCVRGLGVGGCWCCGCCVYPHLLLLLMRGSFRVCPMCVLVWVACDGHWVGIVLPALGLG